MEHADAGRERLVVEPFRLDFRVAEERPQRRRRGVERAGVHSNLDETRRFFPVEGRKVFRRRFGQGVSDDRVRDVAVRPLRVDGPRLLVAGQIVGGDVVQGAHAHVWAPLFEAWLTARRHSLPPRTEARGAGRRPQDCRFVSSKTKGDLGDPWLSSVTHAESPNAVVAAENPSSDRLVQADSPKPAVNTASPLTGPSPRLIARSLRTPGSSSRAGSRCRRRPPPGSSHSHSRERRRCRSGCRQRSSALSAAPRSPDTSLGPVAARDGGLHSPGLGKAAR